MAAVRRPEPPNANNPLVNTHNGIATYEFNLFLQQLYLSINDGIDNGDTIVGDIEDLSAELNATQAGAGLSVDGDYIQEPAANYINVAISLANATIILDTQVKQNADAISLATLGLTVLTKTANYTATAITQTLLCDATAGDMTITLPSAAASYSSNRSIQIGVSKKDTTANTVTVVGTGAATVAGETSQTINSETDVINLITDGTNWHLGA
jgi:hypothetical protein